MVLLDLNAALPPVWQPHCWLGGGAVPQTPGGRAALRQHWLETALNRLGALPVGPGSLTGQHHAPVWPTGHVGSVSILRGPGGQDWLLGWLGRSAHCAALGLDAELLMDEKTATALAPVLLTRAEQAEWARQPDPARWVTQVFCLKEALFNLLSPWQSQPLPFEAAELRVLVPESGQAQLMLTCDWGPVPAGLRLGLWVGAGPVLPGAPPWVLAAGSLSADWRQRFPPCSG